MIGLKRSAPNFSPKSLKMLQRIQYTAARTLMEKELAGIWQDLQSYKERANGNTAAYIDKQERRLTVLMAFFRAADGAILEAEEERAQAYQKGMQAARKESEEPFNRWNPAHKEDYRSYSIHRARTAWPELY